MPLLTYSLWHADNVFVISYICYFLVFLNPILFIIQHINQHFVCLIACDYYSYVKVLVWLAIRQIDWTLIEISINVFSYFRNNVIYWSIVQFLS